MARKNQAAAVELDLVGHEVSRRHTRFPVPVLDNTTYAPPATTNIALDTSPHGESQDLLGALGLPARIFQIPGPVERCSRQSQGSLNSRCGWV